jgi:hypothetical protein
VYKRQKDHFFIKHDVKNIVVLAFMHSDFRSQLMHGFADHRGIFEVIARIFDACQVTLRLINAPFLNLIVPYILQIKPGTWR